MVSKLAPEFMTHQNPWIIYGLAHLDQALRDYDEIQASQLSIALGDYWTMHVHEERAAEQDWMEYKASIDRTVTRSILDNVYASSVSSSSLTASVVPPSPSEDTITEWLLTGDYVALTLA